MDIIKIDSSAFLAWSRIPLHSQYLCMHTHRVLWNITSRKRTYAIFIVDRAR